MSVIGPDFGGYRIGALLGAGAMGEVYRAHDSRLGRDVALKILPPAFTADPDRLARFEREARVLASLNHPHIGAIYGLEEQAGVRALILELVEGETLAERIKRAKRSGMPIDEVLHIARQVTDALDAAHEKGIVHRDLKPANIKITPDGTVKVLDFGLATSAAVEAATAGQSVTVRIGSSQEYLIAGTVAYMSPEQARGQAVDKRSDIWAFGCVLYEMLAGRNPFARETLTDTLSAVVSSDPDWERMPASVPPHVRHLLGRCLTKDPRQRLRDIADAGSELALHQASARLAKGARASVLMRTLPWAVAVVAVAGLSFVLARGQRPQDVLPAPTMERVTSDSGLTEMPTVSRDGRLIAYASNRARSDLDIWVQQIAGGAPVRLTDDPADDVTPDFSPDGSQIVFRSERGGGALFVAPALGGPARQIVADGRRPKFSPDGTRIAYWTGQWRGFPSQLGSAVFVAPLAGGSPVRVAADFRMARDPVWSPDSRSLLFLGRRDRTSPLAEALDWWWVPIDGGPPVKTGLFATSVLNLNGREPAPASWSSAGVMLSIGGEIWRAPISPETGRLEGAPERLATGTAQSSDPTTMADGSVVFGAINMRRLIARASLVNPADPPAQLFADERVDSQRASPTEDGNLIVFEQWSPTQREVWLRDARTGQQQIIARVNDPRQLNAVVSADGARIVYTVGSESDQGIGYVVEVSGGVPREVCKKCSVHGFLPGNRSAIAVVDDNKALAIVDLATGMKREMIRVTDGGIDRPHVSPDGRWLAFRHTKETISKTYVGPFRAADPPPSTSWQQVDEPTSTGRPAGWSLDSRVLYLLLDTDGFRCLWAQRVDPTTGRVVGSPTAARHFHDTYSGGLAGPSTSYGNPITRQGFVYETSEVLGNLWKLTGPGR